MTRSPADRIWDIVLTCTVTCSAILVPLFLVFEDSFSSSRWQFDLLFTFVFVVDIIAHWRRSKDAGVAGARSPYSFGWFSLDLIAAIPFWLLTGAVWLQVLRLAKLARIVHLMRIWRRRSVQHWSMLRLLFFIYWIILSIHWISTGWIVIHGHDDHVGHASDYLKSVYWCVQTLSSVGYGDVLPMNDAEYLYAICVMLFGVGVFGYIVGNMASLLANFDPAKAHYLETMEKLAAFMKYKKVPHPLQRRIREYLEYLWEKRRGYDEASALSALPPQLIVEVSVHLKRDIIEKAPFFRGAGEDLVREIALQMRPVTYLPGDHVFKAGDRGREMYFISKGRLEVVSQDGTTVLTTLSEGEFFGEIALLQNRPRTASVRALEYCDLYTLDKSALDHVLEVNPAFAAQVQESISERLARGM